MNGVPDPIAEFSAAIREWRTAYKWIVRTVIVVKAKGDLRILNGRVLFRSSIAEGDLQQIHLETPSLIIARDTVTAAERFDSTISNIAQGVLEVGDTLFHLPFQIFNNIYTLSAFHSPLYHPSARGGPRLPTVIVTTAPKHMVLYDVGNQELLDWELKAADTPYASVDEIARSLGFDQRDQATLELMAEYPGVIGMQSKVVKGNAEVYINVALGLDKSEFKVGYVAYKPGSNPIRANLKGNKIAWTDHKDYTRGFLSIPLGDYSSVAVFLSYKGSAIHDSFITDPKNPANIRQVTLNAIDENLSKLRKYLLGEGDRPERDLEFAIAAFYFLAGFASIQIGHVEQLREFSDVLAFTTSGKVAVVECTVGPIDANGKLSKLASRCHAIREQLTQAGISTPEVLPVVITSLPRQAISGDLNKAKAFGIAVLPKEELVRIANQASFNLDAEQTYEELKHLIPEDTDL